MLNYVLYKDSMIYYALLAKKLANPNSRVTTLTVKELDDYYNLVVNELEKVRSITQDFTYEIIEEGEARLILPEKPKLVRIYNETKYTFNPQTNCYEISSSLSDLGVKTHVIPFSIEYTFSPTGYKKALNITTKDAPQPGNS